VLLCLGFMTHDSHCVRFKLFKHLVHPPHSAEIHVATQAMTHTMTRFIVSDRDAKRDTDHDLRHGTDHD
jgi:hypothetical protein